MLKNNNTQKHLTEVLFITTLSLCSLDEMFSNSDISRDYVLYSENATVPLILSRRSIFSWIIIYDGGFQRYTDGLGTKWY